MSSKTYTVKQVADILGYSTNSIYTFLKEKRIAGVRLGKGRFRIPEEELARILHLSKQSLLEEGGQEIATRIQKSPGVQLNTLQKLPETLDLEPVVQGSESGSAERIVYSNVFDWFVGFAAIISALGSVLFNRLSETVGIVDPVLFPTFRIMLIISGVGVLASSVVLCSRAWRAAFRMLLSIFLAIGVYGLFQMGDMEAGFIYVSLVCVLFLTTVVRMNGIISLGLYWSILTLVFPLSMFLFPTDIHVSTFSAMIGIPPLTMSLFALFCGSLFLVLFWIGYFRSRALFWVTTFTAAVLSVFVGMYYAHVQSWSTAFFMVTVAYFIGLLPCWRRLQLMMARKTMLLSYGLLGGIATVLAIAVLVVFLLQQNIWDSRQKDFTNKIHVAKMVLKNAVASVKSTAVIATQNAEFVNFIEKKNIEGITKYAKVMYESNRSIRRLVFLDKDGKGIALYPYGTFDEPSYASREYFQKVKATGQPYVTDVFQSRVDTVGRYVISVAVPVQSANGTFGGAIAVSIDIDRLGLQIQEIADASRSESFVVSDAKGTILIHQVPTFIGSVLPKDDALHLGIAGQQGVIQGSMTEGALGMIAYGKVPDLGWGIALRASIENVFSISPLVLLSIFSVISIVFVSSIVLYVVIQWYIDKPKDRAS